MALAKFREAGWEVATYGNCKDLLKDIIEKPPRLLLTNLVLYNGSGVQVLDVLQKIPDRFKHTKVLVVSSFATKENIRECFKRGAKDFLITPFPPENLFPRLIYHLQEKKEIGNQDLEQGAGKDSTATSHEKLVLSLLLDGLNTVATGGDGHATLYKLTKHIERIVSVNRASCLLAEPGGETATVLASNDDPNLFGLRLSLGKYPEISHVLNTGLIVIVDDISKNPLTQDIQNQVKTIRISSIMVLPVKFNGECIGVFSLRSSEAANPFTVDVARLCQGICTSSSPVVHSFRHLLATRNAAHAVATPSQNPTPPSGNPAEGTAGAGVEASAAQAAGSLPAEKKAS
jgi:DNA-binding response OmpR family regulator